MEQKPITFLDGSTEEIDKIMKEFFGLSPEQSYQEIKIDEKTAMIDHPH